MTPDERLARLEHRLKKVYQQAAKELTEKANSYFKRFEKMDEKKRKEVEAGTLSEKEYQTWRQNRIMEGERWMDVQQQMAQTMTNANVVAASYINGELPPIYAQNFNEVGKDAERLLKGYSFDLVDANTIRNLSTQNKTLLPYKFVDGHRDIRWNTRRVNASILQSILQGESLPKMAKRLSSQVPGMNYDSARRNAQTAFTGAQNRGRLDGMKQLQDDGVIVKKEWLATTGDSRTREAHLELHGVQQDIDKPFVNSIGQIMFPGDPNADPSNVYNCRCALVQVIVGFKSREVDGTEEVTEQHTVAQSSDIINTWTRRPDEFAFEIEDAMNAQGFDGLPQLVDEKQFDEMVQQANEGKGFVAQRTYSGPDQETLDLYREQLYEGKWYVDCSAGGAQYGQGMYCAADYDGKLTQGIKNEMAHYQELNVSRGAPISYTETLTLDKSAKIITYDDLYKEFTNYKTNATKLFYEKYVDGLNGYSDEYITLLKSELHISETSDFSELMKIYSKISNTDEYKQMGGMLADIRKKGAQVELEANKMNIGVYATLKGYDAINAVGHGESGSYTVILNRTKLIIRRP